MTETKENNKKIAEKEIKTAQKRHKGRPRLYSDEFISAEAKRLIEYAKETEIPFLQEFATNRGYYSDKCSKWAKKNEDFQQALKKFHDIQAYKIAKAGIKNKANASVAIFTLKNVAGWRDNKDVRMSGRLEGGETRIILVRPGNAREKNRIREVSV